jgi:drug/metabolite transporter (DMT)-like permease
VPAPSPRSTLAPQLLLLAMNAIWGASFAATKIALNAKVPEFALIAARFWLALPCLVPFLPRGRRRRALAAAWRPGVITGVVLFAGYSLQTLGMQETTTSVGGFMTGLIVLLVALGARFILGDRLRRPTVVGLVLGFVGILLLCFGATSDEHRSNSLRGILLQVGSSTCYAGHVLLISRISPRGNELAYSWWQLCVVAIGAPFLCALCGGVGDASAYAADGSVWVSVVYLGMLATALGIAVQSRVQPLIPAGQVAVLFATQPAFTAIAGFLVLGDRLGPLEWCGGALLVAGVLIASRGSRGSEPGARAAAPSAAPQASR